jgi:sugar phosphate isomerase/epimerase
MLYGAMNFPVRPTLKEIESFARLGFDYLELSMDPPQAHHTLVTRQSEEILKMLDLYGMRLVCHLPTFLSTADLNPALRESSLREMLESIEVAADLNPLKLVIHPSYIAGLGYFVLDETRMLGSQALEAIVEKTEKLGLMLCIENMFPRYLSHVDPEEFVEILDRFPTLKLTLDIGHAHIGSEGTERGIAFIESYADRIGHIHASDNLGKEDNHLPIGAGTVEFPKVIKSLKQAGYDDTMTLEVFSRDRDYLRISREKLAGMLDAP